MDLSHKICDLLPRGGDGDALAEAIRAHLVDVMAAERKSCADIAIAIDSGRGNEKEIAKAILQRDNAPSNPSS